MVKPEHNSTIITTSQTYVAPFSGTYQIMAIGGGGGGGGGTCTEESNNEMTVSGGGAGGAGGRYIGLHYLSKGESVKITIGKGGTGGLACNQQLAALIASGGQYCYSTSATQGSNTIVEINGNQYIAGGGYAGIGFPSGGYGGTGGTGTINGRSGGNGSSWDYFKGGSSGANGGRGGNYYGDGGTGGSGSHQGKPCKSSGGNNGNSGAVIISY